LIIKKVAVEQTIPENIFDKNAPEKTRYAVLCRFLIADALANGTVIHGVFFGWAIFPSEANHSNVQVARRFPKEKFFLKLFSAIITFIPQHNHPIDDQKSGH
jgi:hypothetical protein